MYAQACNAPRFLLLFSSNSIWNDRAEDQPHFSINQVFEPSFKLLRSLSCCLARDMYGFNVGCFSRVLLFAFGDVYVHRKGNLELLFSYNHGCLDRLTTLNLF